MRDVYVHLKTAIATASIALIVAGVSGCVPGKPIATGGDDDIAKITIVAKRMSEVDKRAYDAQMKLERVTLVKQQRVAHQ